MTPRSASRSSRTPAATARTRPAPRPSTSSRAPHPGSRSSSPNPTPDRLVQPADARPWLDGHVNLESLGVPVGTERRAHPTLARMEALAALLGSPQLEYPILPLTGTNGKTSATRLATALLVETGLSVAA